MDVTAATRQLEARSDVPYLLFGCFASCLLLCPSLLGCCHCCLLLPHITHASQSIPRIIIIIILAHRSRSLCACKVAPDQFCVALVALLLIFTAAVAAF
jgi:hypothetical protein